MYRSILIKARCKYCFTNVQLMKINLNNNKALVNNKNKMPIHSMLAIKPIKPLTMVLKEKVVITPI